MVKLRIVQSTRSRSELSWSPNAGHRYKLCYGVVHLFADLCSEVRAYLSSLRVSVKIKRLFDQVVNKAANVMRLV